MGLTQLQQDVLAHLTANPGGSRERMIALSDLAEEGFFVEESPEDETLLTDYIRENHRDFCQEGIQRLLDATGLPNPRTVTLATMVVTVQLADGWDDNPTTTDIGSMVEDYLTDQEDFTDARVSTVPLFMGAPGTGGPQTIHVEVLAPITATDREGGYITARQTVLPKLAAMTVKQQGTPPSFPKK